MKLRKYIPELIIFVYAVLFLLTKNPSSEWDRVIVSDGKGYYGYLPALFIYHDTDYGFIEQYESDYFPASGQLFKDFRYDTGNGIVNKYFPGPAVLWLPFFGAGHAAAVILGFPTDGYSLPYQMAIAFAAFFYFWLALLILRKILRFYTKNENAIAWSLLATALATNLIYYTVNAGCQVHVYNFFLINAFIYSILEANKSGRPSNYAAAAFMLGMILISRPQNGLIILALPFICGSSDRFVMFFRKAFMQMLILIPSAIAILIPLLIPVTYWYAKTGNFLLYSYGSETYNLLKPHLFAFLFSFEKGWLLYTPIAAFATLGFIYLFRKSKWQFFSLFAFLFFLVYFMSSWWIWTYTSYISQRVMIDYYAFIAILLVFIFKWIETNRKRILLPIILSGFIALNLMQHFQQLNWIYPAGPVTPKAYFKNFFSFSKGTTFMVPENEILNKQPYANDFESSKPLFYTEDFTISEISHSEKNAMVLDKASNGKPLFIRGMSDYKDVYPVVLKIGGWYNPEVTDSTLSLDVNLGNSRGKYSTTKHNLMPGLKVGKWRYAEMVVYLPYQRSVSDSLFISFENLSKGNVVLDDIQIEILKMKGSELHDWLLKANDPVDSTMLYHTDLETPPEAPWGNTATISSQQSFSGRKSSCIQLSSPYSVGFEKDLDPGSTIDGYYRVGARIMGDTQAEVLLVFDFSSNGKTVFYKIYPVKLNGSNMNWTLSEVFREFPVTRLKAQKVKIYYWYVKGTNPVYIDDIQVDVIHYKPARLIKQPLFQGNKDSETLTNLCCDFEKTCLPQSGFTAEIAEAYSGTKVCLINAGQPYSFSHLLPLDGMENNAGEFIYVSAKLNSDQYKTGVTLVADFRQGGKSVSYNPIYLHGQTNKGQWNSIDVGVKVPEGITTKDSVLVYFYLANSDEEMWIDDFCVSLKKQKHTANTK